jgi:hypothetical protein
LPQPFGANFLKPLKYTLTKFSIFRTQIGVFRQLDSLSMGSCLLSIISNLFVHMLEESVISKFEKSGDVITWLRYADDCCVILKKGSFNKVFDKINKWNHNLFLTYENVTDNSLTFLDCENEKKIQELS